MAFLQFALKMIAPALVAVLLGIVFIGMALSIQRTAQRTQQWAATSGRILTATLKDVVIKRQTRYQTVIDYEYFVRGQRYQSQRLSMGETWRVYNRLPAEQKIRPYRPGQAVTVYYNPDRPKEAVLERGSDRLLLLTLAGFGGIFLGMGLLIGSAVLIGSMQTCGVSVDSTQPAPGSPAWCQEAFQGWLKQS